MSDGINEPLFAGWSSIYVIKLGLQWGDFFL